MTFAVIGPSSFGATPAGAATISAAATTATRIARAPAAGAAHCAPASATQRPSEGAPPLRS